MPKDNKDIKNTVICGKDFSQRTEIADSIVQLAKDSGKNIVTLGSEGDDSNAFMAAVIGYDYKTYAVMYDYNLLINKFMEWDGFSEDEAMEWIDYNTLRSLDYMSDTDDTVYPRIVGNFV